MEQKILKILEKDGKATAKEIAAQLELDEKEVESFVKDLFADRFKRIKSAKQIESKPSEQKHLYKSKRIEQSHIGIVMNGYPIGDKMTDAFSIANIVLGGGMSSRLFQKVREELGLAYSVYSYASQYKNDGIIEIYAGVNTSLRDLAVNAIAEEVNAFKKNGITEQEFERGKEQIKSAFIMGQESTSSQMMLYAKHLLMLDKEFDFSERIKRLESVTLKDVHDSIDYTFDLTKASTATVGSKRTPIKL